jgi:diphosphate-dependent phosphofructokinase
MSFYAGKYHGVVLIPEGLVESIPELYALLQVVFSIIK